MSERGRRDARHVRFVFLLVIFSMLLRIVVKHNLLERFLQGVR
mgnify:CR=1 FL=1